MEPPRPAGRLVDERRQRTNAPFEPAQLGHELAELVVCQRTLVRRGMHAASDSVDLSRAHPWNGRARARQPDGDEFRKVPRAHDVQRHAEQGGLDDLPLLECPRQLLLAEVLQARPQADVRRGGVLSLQSADAFDRPWYGELPPLEQQLTFEQRAIQLAQREHALSTHASRPKSALESA